MRTAVESPSPIDSQRHHRLVIGSAIGAAVCLVAGLGTELIHLNDSDATMLRSTPKPAASGLAQRPPESVPASSVPNHHTVKTKPRENHKPKVTQRPSTTIPSHLTTPSQHTIGYNSSPGPFKTVGNKIIDGNGDPFIARGFTVYGPAEDDWRQLTDETEFQIRSIARDWNVNDVRIQASPNNLFINHSRKVNQAYLASLVQEVNVANQTGLDVIITAQNEHTGGSKNPTMQTEAYWKVIAQKFGPDQNVMFDLFNEPHVDGGNAAETWHVWRDGGKVDGIRYLGMQTMIDDLRQSGISSLFIVEGPGYASTLDKLNSYPLTGSNIVAAVHHPAGRQTTAAWNRDFDDFPEWIPVIDDEWTQYSNVKRRNDGLTTNAECWSDAYWAVPKYLAYLKDHGIGLVTWGMQDGILQNGSSPRDLTHISKRYHCGSGEQGAGSLLWNYFNDAQSANQSN